MDLTVVIASIESSRSIDLCLSHLARSCAGLQVEFIVADASRDDTADRVQAYGGSAILISCRPGTLAPQLWAAGYRKATGRVVAFTTGHCLVSQDWATALIKAIDDGATGAGGPLVIAGGTGPLDWAVFYLRYAGSMPHTLGEGRTAGEIAGDNAAYVRTALDRHATTLSGGFWEIDFHRLVRGDGGWLAAVPHAVIAFSRSFPFATIFRHRFAHGRQFGAGRVKGGTRAAWQIVLAAPLVPFVLAGRAASRAAGGPAPWKFVAALPWFLPLAFAWAGGEAWGALRPC
jgi:glycosyltransferase involved in cell wall biosynthesis